MIQKVSSKDNKNIKLVRQLKKKSFRYENRMFFAEGKKMVLEAVEFAKANLCFVVVSETFFEENSDAVMRLDKEVEKILVVGDNVFNDISDTETPQGILGVISMPEDEFTLSQDTSEVLVLDGVSEPGNMGTVIRTAEALGYEGIYIMKGSADIYSPKTVRSTMGSLFRMKFRTNCDIDDVLALKESGFSVIATTPMGDRALEEFQRPEKIAVVVGNEAHGICDEILSKADFRVKITMSGRAESFNAAVAAGIVLHWLKRE